MTKEAYRSDNSPKPAASYSPAVRKGNMLQISGQVGTIGNTGEFAGDNDVSAQTHEVLKNVNTLLAAAGSSMDDVIMLRVYITTYDHFADMNAVFAQYVTEPYPARTTVATTLAPGVLVEIDALAVLD